MRYTALTTLENKMRKGIEEKILKIAATLGIASEMAEKIISSIKEDLQILPASINRPMEVASAD
jgi:hypothetical protein